MRTRLALVMIGLQAWSLALGTVRAAELAVAPEFTHRLASEWLNSTPLSLTSLRGSPVLLEFWTFDCINCLRSIAWVKSVAQRQVHDTARDTTRDTARDTVRGLVIVSVHTPELAHEKRPENLRATVQKLGITYPVMIDTDYSYWEAMSNRYWPAFYLLDSQGRIAAKHFGELHVGERSAVEFEREIDRLLANAAVKSGATAKTGAAAQAVSQTINIKLAE